MRLFLRCVLSKSNSWVSLEVSSASPGSGYKSVFGRGTIKGKHFPGKERNVKCHKRLPRHCLRSSSGPACQLTQRIPQGTFLPQVGFPRRPVSVLGWDSSVIFMAWLAVQRLWGAAPPSDASVWGPVPLRPDPVTFPPAPMLCLARTLVCRVTHCPSGPLPFRKAPTHPPSPTRCHILREVSFGEGRGQPVVPPSAPGAPGHAASAEPDGFLTRQHCRSARAL